MNAHSPRGLIPERPDPVVVAAPTAAVEPEGGPPIDVHQLGALFRRNLPIIVAAIVAALALGFLITVLTTPTYVAQGRIQIEQQTDRVLATEDAAPQVATQDTERFLQTQLDVLRSRSVAIGVAQSLKLFGNARTSTCRAIRAS